MGGEGGGGVGMNLVIGLNSNMELFYLYGILFILSNLILALF